jgi:hypothetical protein
MVVGPVVGAVVGVDGVVGTDEVSFLSSSFSSCLSSVSRGRSRPELDDPDDPELEDPELDDPELDDPELEDPELEESRSEALAGRPSGPRVTKIVVKTAATSMGDSRVRAPRNLPLRRIGWVIDWVIAGFPDRLRMGLDGCPATALLGFGWMPRSCEKST